MAEEGWQCLDPQPAFGRPLPTGDGNPAPTPSGEGWGEGASCNVGPGTTASIAVP